MKALTVRQPWASLIISGAKDVENRSRRTNHRGPLLIHVSVTKTAKKNIDWKGIPEEFWHVAWSAWQCSTGRGLIIGTVEIVDCVRDSPSEWAFPDHWHWILANPRPVERRLAKGKLGLWEADGR